MKVVIASSISGGHLFPAIAVSKELRNVYADCRILLVTGKREVAIRILEREDFPYVLLPPFPRPGALRLVPLLIRFFNNLIRSFAILRKEAPDVVIGFGGLMSAPILLCSRLLRIPAIIHEQNVVPGRTNLILARFSNFIVVSFEESRAFFKDKDKIIVIGNPIRGSLRLLEKSAVLKGFGFSPENFTLFIMGGSQGARSINRAAVEVFERFRAEERRRFQVVHIAGEKDCGMVQDRYRDLGINSKVYGFMDEIVSAYSASDLIVSRAGSSAIHEINALGKAAILVPYPYARSHQTENAAYMAERDMAVLIKDDKDLASRLYDKILDFYNNRNKMQGFAKVQKLERNGAKNMVNLIKKISGHEG